MTLTLLPQFADYLRTNDSFDLANISNGHPLYIGETTVAARRVQMAYAPFDHVNPMARLVIVGMTPGAFQAHEALRAAARALRAGKAIEEASELAKVHASFSGEPMRSNLIDLLDRIGVAGLLGVDSTASLWAGDGGLVHFTSALRYPVFVDGKNWSGTPDMVRTPKLREWLTSYTGAELTRLPEAVIVPLGPKVAAAMHFLADSGFIKRERILDGLPHPSGANAERIAYFLGRKPAMKLSSKTNAGALDTARAKLVAHVEALSPAA